MSEKLTILIPAYNRGKDLRNALASLMCQTNQDFNVVVSDDAGAEDLSLICKEFENFLHIYYIRKSKNEGIGANRQNLLNFAYTHPTEYVMFLDSDDVLIPTAVDRLLLFISKNQADLVMSDIVVESDKPNVELIKADRSLTWLHGKIYRLQMLKDSEAYFPKMKTNEDLSFNLMAHGASKEVILMEESLYIWRNNQESITRKDQDSLTLLRCKSTDFIEAIYYAFKFLKKKFFISSRLALNIILCYNFYENGKVFGTIEDRHERMISEMLHNQTVIQYAVTLYAQEREINGMKLEIQAYATYKDTMCFYGETLGNWLMRYMTQEEVQAAIKKLQKEGVIK